MPMSISQVITRQMSKQICLPPLCLASTFFKSELSFVNCASVSSAFEFVFLSISPWSFVILLISLVVSLRPSRAPQIWSARASSSSSFSLNYFIIASSSSFSSGSLSYREVLMPAAAPNTSMNSDWAPCPPEVLPPPSKDSAFESVCPYLFFIN